MTNAKTGKRTTARYTPSTEADARRWATAVVTPLMRENDARREHNRNGRGGYLPEFTGEKRARLEAETAEWVRVLTGGK